MFRKLLVTVAKNGRDLLHGGIRAPKTAPHVYAKPKQVLGDSCHVATRSQSAHSTWVNRLVGRAWQNLGSNLRRNAGSQLQSGSASIFSKSVVRRFPLLTFVGIGLVNTRDGPTFHDQDCTKECHELEELCENVKNTIHGKVIGEECSPADDELGTDVGKYDFGSLISKGCCAAVYEAKQQGTGFETGMEESLSKYGLAVKVMFNLYYASNGPSILRGMEKELLPAKEIEESSKFFGRNLRNNKKKKRLPQHPNIVKIKKVFVDDMMEFDQCLEEFGDSLPPRINHDGFGRNKTLYIVMERYPYTLRQYVDTHEISKRTSLFVFAQLLEGILHMANNNVAHRDLKSDNILLCTADSEIPKVYIADFGCSLDMLQLPYNTDEVDKGGNFVLMAPEIAGMEPGENVVLNYSKSDLWAAGTLAYEIFGQGNPFYSAEGLFNTLNYQEDILPEFDESVPRCVGNLIKMILRRNPEQRPSPLIAANVLQLLL